MKPELTTSPNPAKKLANTLVKYVASAMPPLKPEKFIEEENETTYTNTYTLPQNIKELPPEFAEHYITDVEIKPSKIYYLNNVYTTWQGVVFKNFRIFIPSLFAPESITYFQEPLLLKQWVGDVINADDKNGVAIAHNQFAPHNYFHWMIDTLPRLLILSRRHPGVRLIIPDAPAGFITETAPILGFKEFVKANPQQIVKANLLIMPDEHTTPLGHNDPVIIREVKDRIIRHFGPPASSARKRIFISREKQRLRKIANQSEVDAVLQEYGFEKVYFEGLSVREQVQLMQEASIILSVHGANMVNCIFCEAGTPIIELISQRQRNPVYWRLSSIFSLPYYVLPCPTIPDEPINFHTNLDLHVNIPDLTSLLKKAIDENHVK